MKRFHLISLTVIWAFAITYGDAEDYQERAANPKSFSNEVSCYKKGDNYNGNMMRIASYCIVETTLSHEYFPRFFNEEVCDEKDRGCFLGEGKTVQNVMFLTFQRRTENGDWEHYTQAIRTGCECLIYNDSTLKAYIEH
jgi:hypothetical protein